MRRRWLSLLLVGGISLSLAACGGGDGPSAGEGGGKSAPALAAPGPAAPGSAGTLAGEWVSREADLYFAFFEDGYCIYARAQSMNRVNGMSDYNAAGGCLSMTADVGDLSTYTISGDVMTLKVDGTDYTFIRPVSPAVENGDYSVRADTEVMKKLAYYMERAVGDTLVKFDGDRQVYATPLATFSVPISARRWADTYEYNSGIAHCVVDFFGFDGNVEVDVQVSSNNRRGTTPERFKEQFAEDYPGAEIGSQSAGDQGQYEIVYHSRPDMNDGFARMDGQFSFEEPGGTGWTTVTTTTKCEAEGVSNLEAWNDPFVQAILNSITFPDPIPDPSLIPEE